MYYHTIIAMTQTSSMWEFFFIKGEIVEWETTEWSSVCIALVHCSLEQSLFSQGKAGEQGWHSGEHSSPTNVARVRFLGLQSNHSDYAFMTAKSEARVQTPPSPPSHSKLFRGEWVALHGLRRAEQVEVFRFSIFALQTCYLVAYV